MKPRFEDRYEGEHEEHSDDTGRHLPLSAQMAVAETFGLAG